MPVSDTLQLNPDTLQRNSFFPAIPKFDAEELAASIKQFTGKTLKWGEHGLGKPIDHSSDSWQFSLLLGVLIIFVVIRIGYINLYRQLLDAFGSIRYMRQLLREDISLTHPFSLFLILNFSICTGLLLYFLADQLNVYPFYLHGIALFGLFAGSVLLLVFTKSILLVIVQFVIGEDGGQSENRYSILIFNQVIGILLLPVAVFAAFGPENLRIAFVWSGLALIALFYLIRLGRSLIVGINSGSGLLYLFLYLCALELTPLIVSIKLLMREIG